MTPSNRRPVAAFTRSSVTTTVWVGMIGVRPANTRKVMTAESMASTTSAGPTMRTLPRRSFGSLTRVSALTACSMLMERRLGPKADRLRPPNSAGDAFIQQCCRIATFPRRNDPQQVGSEAAAINRDVEVADLLAQRVAVEAEQIGGADLVAAGGR